MTVKEQAEKLYKKVNTFILTCEGEDGYPQIKAVVPAKTRETMEELYFCTNTSSQFAQTLAKNQPQKASVYFYSRKLVWKGCSLKGTMEICDDMKLKEKFWQSKFKNAYAEKSFTDHDFCLLKFTPISGRYYAWYKPQDFTIKQ